MAISVVHLDMGTAERAAELRARHEGLRLSDGVVLATSHQLRAPLPSYGRRHQRYTAEEEANQTMAAADSEPPRH